MWIWIIIIAVIIGALWGAMSSDGDNGAGAAAGAITAGCLAGGCLLRLFVAGMFILGILWLFGLIFG